MSTRDGAPGSPFPGELQQHKRCWGNLARKKLLSLVVSLQTSHERERDHKAIKKPKGYCYEEWYRST